jgi:transposase InsO family protein
MVMVERLSPGWEQLHVALAAEAITHKRTRPYTPRTNGRAERFIQTSLREWAYAIPFESSAERARAMPAWLCDYNRNRPPLGPQRKTTYQPVE